MRGLIQNVNGKLYFSSFEMVNYEVLYFPNNNIGAMIILQTPNFKSKKKIQISYFLSINDNLLKELN